jgi:penicillin-binding protein 1A
MADGSISSEKVTIKREAGGIRGWYGRVHRRWWFRILAWLALLAGLFWFLIWAADRAQPALGRHAARL